MSSGLTPVTSALVDGENNPIALETAYRIPAVGAVDTLKKIIARHGPNCLLLPISAASAGGGIFQTEIPGQGHRVGIKLDPSNGPEITIRSDVDITSLSLDDIFIDTANQWIYAGAAITLDQLNLALNSAVSNRYRVLGADLTSYSYAQAGATFMTGGMGPQRRYFSQSVDQIVLFNGKAVEVIDRPELDAYEGTYGWTGLVTAVRCRYYQIPCHEIAFAMPVGNTSDDLARLLSHLSPLARLNINDGSVKTVDGGTDLIMGIEHITAEAMGPLFASGQDNAVTRLARELKQKCDAAEVGGLVFVSGFSEQPLDEFFESLIDNPDQDQPEIAGISLMHTRVFTNPEQMREVREAVPFAARTQSPTGQFSYKGHTDATICLNPDRVRSAMHLLWDANTRYVDAVDKYFATNPLIKGQILVYGHLNPTGVDPHNRITLASDDHAAFVNAERFVLQARNRFYRELHQICEQTGSTFVGGEKGAGSEYEMFESFRDTTETPPALAEKLSKQKQQISKASSMFRWRAFPLYLS